MSELDEVISEDFGFKLSVGDDGLSLFTDPIDMELVENEELSVFAVANVKRWFAASNVHSVVVGSLDSISGESLGEVKIINGFSKVTHVYFNSNESILYILDDGKVKKADVSKSLDAVGSTSDFSSMESLDSIGKAKSIRPSPSVGEALAIFAEEQRLYIAQGNRVENIASGVTSYCWSNSGRQLFHHNGDSITTVDIHDSFELQIPTSFENLDDFAKEDYDSVFLAELETNKRWLVVYDLRNATVDDHDIKHFVISKTNAGLSVNSLDICPPYSSAQRYPSYYMAVLQNWIPEYSHALITSALSTDVNTVTTNPPDGIFVTAQSEDTNRAQFPIDDESGDDLSPVGISLDFSRTDEAVQQPCTGVDEVRGKLPKLWVLSHTGKLIGWWVFDKKGINENKVSLEGPMQMVRKFATSTTDTLEPNQNNGHSSPFSGLQDKNKPSAFTLGSVEKDSDVSSVKDEQKVQAPAFGSFGSFGSSTSSKAPAGSTGSGSSSFGSSGNGTSGFGSSGFGKSSFGASGFGASGFGASGFGASGFGSKPETGNNRFGSSFSPGANKSTDGPKSNFGSYANKSSLQGSNPASGVSPFASLNSATPGPSSSPFASLQSNNNSSKSSPFAGLNSNSQDSPFSKLASNAEKSDEQKNSGSPFAALGSNAKESPFSKLSLSTNDTPSSPFASLNSSTKDSPFSKLTKDPEVADKTSESKNSSFGSKLNFGESSQGANATKSSSINFGSTSNFSEIKHASSATDSPNDNKGSKGFSFGSNFSSNESPFSKFAQGPTSSGPFSETKPSSLSSFGDSFKNSMPDVPPATNDTNEKDSNIPEDESPTDTEQHEPTAADENKFSQADPMEYSTENLKGAGFELPPVDSTKSTQKQELKTGEDSKSQKELIADNDIPFSEEKSTSSSGSQFESTSEEVSNESDGAGEDFDPNSTNEISFNDQGSASYKVGDVLDAQERTYQSTLEKNEPTDKSHESVEVKSKDFMDAEPLPQSIQFHVYDSSTLQLRNGQSDIEKKIYELYLQTSGHLEVLRMNTDELSSFLDSHSDPLEGIDSEALQFPEKWRLANISDLREMIDREAPKFAVVLKQLQSHEADAKNLSEQVSEFQTVKVQIDKLLSELHLLSLSSTSRVLARRPLDFQNEELKNSLRRKLNNVKDLEKELISLMMPLKSKLNMNDSTVRNMQKVAFYINDVASAHSREVDSLTQAISKISLQGPPQQEISTESHISRPTSQKPGRWRLSEMFSNVDVKPKLVSIE